MQPSGAAPWSTKHVRRQVLYQLMIAQLHDDGFEQLAAAVSNVTLTPPATGVQRNRLASLVDVALADGPVDTEQVTGDRPDGQREATAGGLSFGGSSQTNTMPKYEERYCDMLSSLGRCVRFHPLSKLTAVGTDNGTVMMYDVLRVKGATGALDNESRDLGNAPVVRSFSDHTLPIGDVAFHPTRPLLLSGSKDCTIRIYNYSDPTARRAVHVLNDSHAVRAMAMHPGGQHVLVGSADPPIRIFDVEQHPFPCYTTSNPKHHHAAPVTDVAVSADGKFFVTSSKDGSIAVWDAVNLSLVHKFESAHASSEVNSIAISRNGKYILSGGKDLFVRLWDVGQRRQLKVFPGVHQQKYRVPVVFDHKETSVLTSDSVSNLIFWDARAGAILCKTPAPAPIAAVASSHHEPVLCTAGIDRSVRIWVGK